ncbi:TetR/AcrR family transcriptional regulator [Cytobacillus praedii]|uniref:TetR/AcrR family transcriptional regulator n=1 Tax=Cytobacillus praedii TaxID=1742358 RepID=A0A4V6NAT2_9BACI|nr:TetR/AcrR family transcriptional regulator [Cytobacillus praedii]TCJ03040.1 TetR/AcrR family transcriptional regulator [Cytobacillus praedii]
MNHEDGLSRRQQKAMQTRLNLLHAGKVIFLKEGFQKATMTEINKQANTGYGTAYVYFKNKDELFGELMENIVEKMYEVASLPFEPKTSEEAFEQIKTQVRLFIQAALDEQEMMKVLKEAIGVSEIVEGKWSQIRTRFIAGIIKDITFVQEAGMANKEIEASLIARGWYYMNEQVMWDILLGEVAEDLNRVAENLALLYTRGLYVGNK